MYNKIDIISGPVQSGKTLQLIKKCAIEGGYIVCRDRREANPCRHRPTDWREETGAREAMATDNTQEHISTNTLRRSEDE